MKFKFYFFLCIVSFVLLFNDFSFGQFFDNFEYYFPDQPVACQKPQYWTTFSLIPCDPVEDAYVSSNHAYSGSYSLKIVQNNDLVKPYFTQNFVYINFMVYIPSGKAGYFNILSGFYPDPDQWAMECYFDAGGSGRIIHGNTDNFSWSSNTWHMVSVNIDLLSDQADFYFDYDHVSSWQWSQGGSIDPQVEAIDFYGATVNDEMYVDDFTIWDGCLSCGPPDPAYNLTSEEIFSQDPAVSLSWQNYAMFIYGFNIIRKTGYPNDPGNFEYIGNTEPGVTNFVDSLVTINERYSYGVVTDGQYGYSDTSNFTTILVLPTPVELVSFSGSAGQNNDVILSWITATETNNRGFEIERQVYNPQPASPPGGSTVGKWEKIGFVEGNGTTTEMHSYSFKDENVSPGKFSYRLKQIDFDGTYKYSNVVEVETQNTVSDYSLSQNYPNPFNPTTIINYQLKIKNFVSLKVYNTLGEKVATLVNEEKPAGSYEVKLNGSNLPSGVYIYRLTAGNFSDSKKLVLVR